MLHQRRNEAHQLFIPLPHLAEIHNSKAQYLIWHGSNRSGKTEAAAWHFSMAVCGRLKTFPKHNGKALMVGLDRDHLANPMAKKLLQPGSFWIIKDEVTGEWRSVRPDAMDPTRLDPYDEAYREKWKEGPPLIPERMVANVAWEDKKKGVPRLINLVNGWTILCRTSEGNPSQGTEWNIGLFDEQLENKDFYYEFCRGAVSQRGVLLWAASLQNLSPELKMLLERAESGDKNVCAVKALAKDNPYIPVAEKQEWYNSMTEEERQVRWYGFSAASTRLIYRNYSQDVHTCEPFPIPKDYCVYLAVDPGNQHCGTVLAALDPDETHVWVFKSFDMAKDSIDKWAMLVKEALDGHPLEAMVMDTCGGRQRGLSSDITAAEFYAAGLERQGVIPRQIGPFHGFFRGSKDVKGREEALRAWLDVRSFGHGKGTPKLLLFRGETTLLQKQIRDAHYKLDKAKKEVRNPNMDADLLDAMEYMASVGPTFGYYPPDKSVGEIDASFEWFKTIQRTNRL